MKRSIPILLLSLASFTAYSQAGAEGEMARREKVNADFQNSKSSPLDPGDLKKFTGLNYFPIDPAYRVQAKFVKTEKPVIFKMKMTASPKMEYIAVGFATFELLGVQHKLTAYKKPEGADAFFIPFTDATNGKETYESGRYVEFPVPAGDQIILDFNGAYNPYCAYSRRFSCPIPPAENHLGASISAGEKKFKESH